MISRLHSIWAQSPLSSQHFKMELHWLVREDWDGDGELNIFEVGVASDGDGDGFPAGPTDFDDNNPTVAANCDSGKYGRFTCRDATPGYYASGTGNTIMTPASPGNYVDFSGATTQLPCPVGKFQELSGQTSCDDAEPGYYVPAPGASAVLPVQKGKYNDQYGMIQIRLVSGQKPGTVSQC
ncbi:MAG: hypothetical protein CM15mP105_3070 [Methanobacteriota archaeon]|nr:MAG: hypothetical protein CM15mP105_3070 [Euryarchaeota archaeon]